MIIIMMMTVVNKKTSFLIHVLRLQDAEKKQTKQTRYLSLLIFNSYGIFRIDL
jgi:hypothetical protein